ncbi:16S rRNA processing protein RimM [Beijerinckia indica subsp. indica ATCC 9039]|uniref:Ribosome maturation factor RimM n=1 Tax=Beijerinckia indica subsp. indica (strain ATCC 9039 / DSM 1715 / NCIMB 8712) TaxID=395963 RepID=RIMM_BEII9|nr:RecName: Full=Ribosome maturation factor RimM [Beijerinckia indica subsp. indica ATCC 9039]ACB96910.1 16S rRNA processing protein RimM [Beijerinckia indica subsp. indica ATCC 9039]
MRGEVRLQSFTEVPQAISAYGPLSDASGKKSFSIASLRLVKNAVFVARIEGVTTREAAEALTNLSLYVSREALPPPEEEEFYLADLIGLDAFVADADGKEVLFGRIADVLNFGGGDILEIAPSDGGETRLLPFTRQVVPRIDLTARRVLVVPPEEVEAQEPPEKDAGGDEPSP